MDAKSPKRAREAADFRETSEKRIKPDSGEAMSKPRAAVLAQGAPQSPTTFVQPPQENLQTVRKSYVRLAETKAKLIAAMDYPNFRAEKEVVGMIPTVSASIRKEFGSSDIREQYKCEERKREVLQQEINAHEERLRELKESLRVAQSDTQAKVREKKMTIDELEARKSATLEQKKKENERLRSVVENYRRLTGMEICPMDCGSHRIRLRLQQKEIILRALDVSETEMEVQVISYTVPAEKIPAEIKDEIIIEKKDGPKLMHLLLSCLL